MIVHHACELFSSWMQIQICEGWNCSFFYSSQRRRDKWIELCSRRGTFNQPNARIYIINILMILLVCFWYYNTGTVPWVGSPGVGLCICSSYKWKTIKTNNAIHSYSTLLLTFHIFLGILKQHRENGSRVDRWAPHLLAREAAVPSVSRNMYCTLAHQNL